MKKAIFTAAALVSLGAFADKQLTKPIVGDDLIFEEKDGLVAVEAEHFFKQENDDIRA